MNNNVFEPILLSKQRRQKKLLKQNCKHRAATSTRRIILDATYSDVFSTSSNTLDRFTEKNSISSDVHQHTFERSQELNSDIDTDKYDESNELNNNAITHDSLSELNISPITYDNGINSDIEAFRYDDSNKFNNISYEYDDLNVLDSDDHLCENLVYNLSSCFTLSNRNLHNWTNLSTQEFCAKLLLLVRAAKMCKSQTDKLIQLIHSSLPVPNNMPKSIKQILVGMQGSYLSAGKIH